MGYDDVYATIPLSTACRLAAERFGFESLVLCQRHAQSGCVDVALRSRATNTGRSEATPTKTRAAALRYSVSSRSRSNELYGGI